MLTNVIPNSLNIIKHAVIQNKVYCRVPHTIETERLCSILYDHGYILGYRLFFTRTSLKCHRRIHITLKKSQMHYPLTSIHLISRAGNNVYWTLPKLKKEINRAKSITKFILSTSRGLLISDSALELGVGGKVICRLA